MQKTDYLCTLPLAELNNTNRLLPLTDEVDRKGQLTSYFDVKNRRIYN